MEHDLRDEFFEMVDEQVLDEYMRQKRGHKAEETVELPDVTKAEMEILISGLITAYNTSLNDGNASMAAIHYRLIQRLLDVDEDVAREFEEAQQVTPFEALFGHPENR